MTKDGLVLHFVCSSLRVAPYSQIQNLNYGLSVAKPIPEMKLSLNYAFFVAKEIPGMKLKEDRYYSAIGMREFVFHFEPGQN